MKKIFLSILVFVMIITTMVACGGVKYPTDKQILEDIQQNADYPICYTEIDSLPVYVREQNFTSGEYLIDEATAFKSTVKPKTKDGQVYISGELTLKTTGIIEVNVRYDIYDDNSCEFISVYQEK